MNGEQLQSLSEEVRALATRPESSEGSRASVHLLELARKRPADLIPLLPEISRLLDSASSQAREVSLQSLALVSRAAPGAFAFLLPRLHTLLSRDSTETVSEQAIEILTNYGRSSRKAAERVIPIFTNTVGKVNARALRPIIAGLSELSAKVPEASRDIAETIDRLQQSMSGGIRHAATRVVKNIRKEDSGDS